MFTDYRLSPFPRWLLLAAVLMACAAFARAGTANAVDDQPFDSGADARAQIEAAIVDRGSDKRILLVFGGNWCGDSRSLVRRFHGPDLAPLMEREFRVLYIAVGRRQRQLEVAERYGNPIDKGVPSVALLAPDGRLLHADHGSLSSAGRMSDPAIAEFFTHLAAAYPAS